MSDNRREILIAGGGAAGMMAALAAAGHGAAVTLIEKNEKLGKKLFITGKGRCNVTNAADMDEVFQNVVSNPRFLYSAFSCFDNQALMALLERLGVRLKVERGNRVFPVSDHSSDIIRALERELRRLGVKILLQREVNALVTETLPEDSGRRVTGVRLRDGQVLRGDGVILACGGLSYPSTGSTGDGYRLAAETGHQIRDCVPALVPLEVQETEAASLQGLTLKNVSISLLSGKKCLYQGFGEMLFTHFGVSGPLILSASSYASRMLPQERLKLIIDLKPALTEEQLHKRILREFSQARNRQLKNVISSLYPGKLLPVILSRSGVSPEKQVNEVTKEERSRLVEVTKRFSFTITGTRGYQEAIITRGGVSVRQVDPATMESKLVKSLYFAGEMLDLDALTGGYNLQIAWSTAYLAGSSAASERRKV